MFSIGFIEQPMEKQLCYFFSKALHFPPETEATKSSLLFELCKVKKSNLFSKFFEMKLSGQEINKYRTGSHMISSPYVNQSSEQYLCLRYQHQAIHLLCLIQWIQLQKHKSFFLIKQAFHIHDNSHKAPSNIYNTLISPVSLNKWHSFFYLFFLTNLNCNFCTYNKISLILSMLNYHHLANRN